MHPVEKAAQIEEDVREQDFGLSAPQIFRILYDLQFTPRRRLSLYSEGINRETQIGYEATIQSLQCDIFALTGQWDKALDHIPTIPDLETKTRTYMSLARLRAHSATKKDDTTRELLHKAAESAFLLTNPSKSAQLLLDIASIQEHEGLCLEQTIEKADQRLKWSSHNYTTDIMLMDIQKALIRREEMKPPNERSKERQKAIIEKALVYFELDDWIRVTDLASYADYFYLRYAELNCIEDALERAAKIMVSETQTTALMGIVARAAEINHPQLPDILNTVVQKIRNGTDYWQQQATYHQILPVLVKNPAIAPIADELMEAVSGILVYPQRRSALLAEKARFLYYTVEALKETSLDPETYLWLQQTSVDLQKDLLAEIKEIPSMEKMTYFDMQDFTYIYRIMSYLGEPMREHFVNFFSISSEKQKSTFLLKPSVIISNMAHAGYLSDAYQASEFISDTRERIATQLEILKLQLIRDPKPIDGEAIVMNDILGLTNVADTDSAIGYARAFGYYSHTTSESVLRDEFIPLHVKVGFIIGRAQNDNWRNFDKTNPLALCIRFLRQERNIPRTAIQQLIDGLVETQDYRTISTQLFALLNHKRTNNYTQILPDTPHPVEVISGLLQIENPKAFMLTTQLLANPDFAEDHPDDRQRLFEMLFTSKYWSKQLHDMIIQRSQNDTLGQKYLEFISFLASRYDIACTPQILSLIEQADKPITLKEMMQRTEKLLNYAKRFDTMPPAEWAQTLLADSYVGLPAYYLYHSGRHQYGYITSYPYETFTETVMAIASLGINSVRYSRFRRHLIDTGMAQKDALSIMNKLRDGLYPFNRGNCRHIFTTEADIDFEQELYLKSLQNIRWQLWALALGQMKGWKVQSLSELMEKARQDTDFVNTNIALKIAPFIFDFDKKWSVSKIKDFVYREWQITDGWRQKFWSRVVHVIGGESLRHDLKILMLDLIKEANLLLDNMALLEQRGQPIRIAEKKYLIEFIEKGKDPIRFARSVDGIAQCVNSSNISDHVNYMSRRLVDPGSFAVDITDISTGRIIGGVDMRLGINSQTGLMELFCVGIYSSGKNKSFIHNVLQFIEKNIAFPLRLGAVNIASVYGGEIGQPYGYDKVENRQFIAFSPVITQDGGFLKTRGDDILKDYNYREIPRIDFNSEFLFKGYRREVFQPRGLPMPS